MLQRWFILLLALLGAWNIEQAGSAVEDSKPPDLHEVKKHPVGQMSGIWEDRPLVLDC